MIRLGTVAVLVAATLRGMPVRARRRSAGAGGGAVQRADRQDGRGGGGAHAAQEGGDRVRRRRGPSRRASCSRRATRPRTSAPSPRTWARRCVITGLVKRDGRRWELSVGVRDGKTGKTRERLRYPLPGPRMTPEVLTLLAKEVDAAFDAAAVPEAAAPGSRRGRRRATSTPPPAPPQPTPPQPQREQQAQATPPPPPSQREQQAQATPPPSQRESVAPPPSLPEPPPPVVHNQVSKPAPADRRPRWAPYFDLSVGPTVSGRTFDFDPRRSRSSPRAWSAACTADARSIRSRARGSTRAARSRGSASAPPSTSRSGPTRRRSRTRRRSSRPASCASRAGCAGSSRSTSPCRGRSCSSWRAGAARVLGFAKDATRQRRRSRVPDVRYMYAIDRRRASRIHFADWAWICGRCSTTTRADTGPMPTAPRVRAGRRRSACAPRRARLPRLQGAQDRRPRAFYERFSSTVRLRRHPRRRAKIARQRPRDRVLRGHRPSLGYVL